MVAVPQERALVPQHAWQRRRTVVYRAVSRLDRWLRQRQNIFEFTADPGCLLRIAVISSREEVTLADGTQIHPGDPIVELHLWNEHIPPFPKQGLDLAWGLLAHERLRRSMAALAVYLEREDRLADVKACRGETVFVLRGGRQGLSRVLQRYGFELPERDPPRSLSRRIHDMLENLLLWGMVWAFNPAGLQKTKLVRERHPVWISRSMLLGKYGREVAAHRSADPSSAAD